MAGESKINRLILLGTPSLGSANTVENMIKGSKLALKRIMPLTLATLPSAYQLLPNSDRKPLIGIDGRPLRTAFEDGASPERDIFDVDTWRELRWSVFSTAVPSRIGASRAEMLQRYFAKQLLRAGRLQSALEREQPASPVKLIVFGADCRLTPSRVLVESDKGHMIPRFEPDKIAHPLADHQYDALMREPGDGLVNTQAAQSEGQQEDLKTLEPPDDGHGREPQQDLWVRHRLQLNQIGVPAVGPRPPRSLTRSRDPRSRVVENDGRRMPAMAAATKTREAKTKTAGDPPKTLSRRTPGTEITKPATVPSRVSRAFRVA